MFEEEDDDSNKTRPAQRGRLHGLANCGYMNETGVNERAHRQRGTVLSLAQNVPDQVWGTVWGTTLTIASQVVLL